IGQRTDQQRDARHRNGPREHEGEGSFIGKAKLGGEPKADRHVRQPVGGDVEKLQGKREPQLTRSTIQHREFAEKPFPWVFVSHARDGSSLGRPIQSAFRSPVKARYWEEG